MTKLMKKDSRKKSMVETVTDIVIGFLIYLPFNMLVLPYFTTGIEEYSLATALTISAIYTSTALTRKYLIRRWFVNTRFNPSQVLDSLYRLKPKFLES